MSSSVKPYYLPQNNWDSDDYYSLHRYLHRLVLHADKKANEISDMDLSKMSQETKVLLYCIIQHYRLENLFDLENLRELKQCKPLPQTLVLGNHNFKDATYSKMNIVF
ncbi:MAG: hypothetical protein K6F27_09020 [Ruminococcus sp.]|nr:hypothetical protein [Ruminococcus sp.]